MCYGEVALNWTANIATTLTAEPQVMSMVLVYSPNGEPQTIASGDILVESAYDFAFEQSGLAEGRWAYYSLFVNYLSSGGDNYFERVASLSVIVPKNYQSNLMLWNRIPEYYRTQDVRMGSLEYSPCLGNTIEDEPVGPLFKMLSVIGFDMDRIRTLIDYLMVANDPALANTESLDALSQQMAVMLSSADLGGSRLRNLMESIGYFRRTKGTLEGTSYFAKAISGSDIEIDSATGDITIFSQRVNYITVPKTGTGIVTYRAAGEIEEITPLLFSNVTYGVYTQYINYVDSTFTNDGGVHMDIAPHVMIHVNSVVPVRNTGTDKVVFSIHSGVGTEGIRWARLVNSSGTQLGIQYNSILTDGVRAFEITAVDADSGVGWTNAYIELLVDQEDSPTFVLKRMLAERNLIGKYFDGDTVRGGWLIDASSVSDYRWSGSANSSPSIFAEDYERTKGVLGQMLFDVLPITEVGKYTVVQYNAIPGL